MSDTHQAPRLPAWPLLFPLPSTLLPTFLYDRPLSACGSQPRLLPREVPSDLIIFSTHKLRYFPSNPHHNWHYRFSYLYQLPGQIERCRRAGHFLLFPCFYDWVHSPKVPTILYLCLCSDACVTARSSDDTALSKLASATPAHLLLLIHSELGN